MIQGFLPLFLSYLILSCKKNLSYKEELRDKEKREYVG